MPQTLPLMQNPTSPPKKHPSLLAEMADANLPSLAMQRIHVATDLGKVTERTKPTVERQTPREPILKLDTARKIIFAVERKRTASVCLDNILFCRPRSRKKQSLGRRALLGGLPIHVRVRKEIVYALIFC